MLFKSKLNSFNPMLSLKSPYRSLSRENHNSRFLHPPLVLENEWISELSHILCCRRGNQLKDPIRTSEAIHIGTQLVGSSGVGLISKTQQAIVIAFRTVFVTLLLLCWENTNHTVQYKLHKYCIGLLFKKKIIEYFVELQKYSNIHYSAFKNVCLIN